MAGNVSTTDLPNIYVSLIIPITVHQQFYMILFSSVNRDPCPHNASHDATQQGSFKLSVAEVVSQRLASFTFSMTTLTFKVE